MPGVTCISVKDHMLSNNIELIHLEYTLTNYN